MKLANLKAIAVKPEPGTWCILMNASGHEKKLVCVDTGYATEEEAYDARQSSKFPVGWFSPIRFYVAGVWHNWPEGYTLEESTGTPMNKVKVTVYKQFEDGFIETIESVIVDEEKAAQKSMALLKKHPGDDHNVMCERINLPNTAFEPRPISFAKLQTELVEDDKRYPFEVIISGGVVRVQHSELKKDIYAEVKLRENNLVIDFGSWDSETGRDQQTGYVVLDFEAMLEDLLPF